MKKFKERLGYPVPVVWGLLALLLFVGFTVVTQAQFNRINADRLYDAKTELYLAKLQEYDTAVAAHDLCVYSVQDVGANKKIFAVVASIFADIDLYVPVADKVKELINEVDALPNVAGNCPDIPIKPVKPVKP